MPRSRPPAPPSLAGLARRVTAPAAASPDVVISQVYGGGGNSGATLHERLHRALQPRHGGGVASTAGRVQYASRRRAARGRSRRSTGSIAPGGHYLVQESAGAGGTTPLPAPDATGSIAMSGTAGKVALRDQHGGARLRDRTASAAPIATSSATAPPTPSRARAAPRLSNTTAAERDGAAARRHGRQRGRLHRRRARARATRGGAAGRRRAAVASSDPADGAADVPVGGNDQRDLHRAGRRRSGRFTLECDGAAHGRDRRSAAPTRVHVDPDADLRPATACTLTVAAAVPTGRRRPAGHAAGDGSIASRPRA